MQFAESAQGYSSSVTSHPASVGSPATLPGVNLEWIPWSPKVLVQLAALIALSACASTLPQTQANPSPTPVRCADASPQAQIDAGKLPLPPRSPLISCVLSIRENVGDYGFAVGYYRMVDGRELQVNECRGCKPVAITDAKTRDIAGRSWYHTDVDGHYSLYTTLPDGTYVAFYVPRGKTDAADLELLTEIALTLR